MTPATRLYPKVALFAAVLASAGIPLYIHLPSFAASELGIDLATLGGVLITIRLIDLIQDPALGWLVDRYAPQRLRLSQIGLAGLALGFLMLFVLPAPIAPLPWLMAALIVVFTSYSLLHILFYGQGVTLAGGSQPDAHLKLAGWREGGLLGGVLIAASAPQILITLGRDAPYREFGLLLVALIALAALSTRALWTGPADNPVTRRKLNLRQLWAPAPMWLLLIGLINALPVALSSTLFIFFVEDRLQLPHLTGPFLLLFFLSAGLAAPFWAKAAKRWGARQVLVPAMTLAIFSFGWAAVLEPGSAWGFTIVCLASGAALAADMVILPALFAASLARFDLPEGIGFGLWSFAAKVALALAAAVALPALQAAGYSPAAQNGADALNALGLAYAVVPSLLKLIAIFLLLATPRQMLYPESLQSART